MNNRRLPFVAILASIVFFFAFTSRASAGYESLISLGIASADFKRMAACATPASKMPPALAQGPLGGYTESDVPNRPAGVTLKTFSGVLDSYGYGNHFGEFGLTAGSKVTTFCLGAPMHMNGKIITCRDPAIP